MTVIAIDSTIVVAALFHVEPRHESCLRLLDDGAPIFFAHGLAEVFSTMTGGHAAMRIPPRQAAELLADDLVPALRIVTLSPSETTRAITECAGRGIQGGAIYDFLHLVTARKAKAEVLYTLKLSHFRAFHRAEDPPRGASRTGGDEVTEASPVAGQPDSQVATAPVTGYTDGNVP